MAKKKVVGPYSVEEGVGGYRVTKVVALTAEGQPIKQDVDGGVLHPFRQGAHRRCVSLNRKYIPRIRVASASVLGGVSGVKVIDYTPDGMTPTGYYPVDVEWPRGTLYGVLGTYPVLGVFLLPSGELFSLRLTSVALQTVPALIIERWQGEKPRVTWVPVPEEIFVVPPLAPNPEVSQVGSIEVRGDFEVASPLPEGWLREGQEGNEEERWFLVPLQGKLYHISDVRWSREDLYVVVEDGGKVTKAIVVNISGIYPTRISVLEANQVGGAFFYPVRDAARKEGWIFDAREEDEQPLHDARRERKNRARLVSARNT